TTPAVPAPSASAPEPEVVGVREADGPRWRGAAVAAGSVLLLAALLLVVFKFAAGSHPGPGEDENATGPDKDGPRPGNRPTVIVSQKGGGQYPSIRAAIAAVKPGTRILVRPGVYREGLVVTANIEIAGDGPRDQVVIENRDAPCLSLLADAAV